MTIGPAGLAHDGALVAVIGRTPAQLENVRSARIVHGFGSVPAELLQYAPLRAVLVAGAVLLLVPIAVFVVMATRIAAAQREQRLAAIRLVGANRHQIATVAAVDTATSTLAGIAVGIGLAEFGRRILVATVIFQGGHFHVEDAVPGVAATVGVGFAVFALTIAATLMSLARVQLSPLGIVRRSRTARPGVTAVWRLLPLGLGLGLAGVLTGHGLLGLTYDHGALIGLPILLTFAAFVSTLVGLVLAGPWLCALIGTAMARLSRRASGVIAGHRIAADPWGTFRAVAGVAIAAFGLTYVAGLTTTAHPTPPGRSGTGGFRPGVVEVNTGGVPTEGVAPLLGPGTVVERRLTDAFGGYQYPVPCAEMTTVMVVSCPYEGDTEGLFEPTGPVDDLPVVTVYIATDGSRAAMERARTRATLVVPNAVVNVATDPLRDDLGFSLLALVQAGSLVVLLVAACSVAAGTVGGLIERRRSFALLRATGVPLSRLRAAVVLETAVPLVATSMLAAGVGLLTANALLGGRHGVWHSPGTATLAILGAGMLAALALAALFLPLLNAVTRHDAVRYE